MTRIIKKKNLNDYIRIIFHDEEWEKRAEAARKLGYLQDTRAVNLMCRALINEKDYMVINRIIEALGRLGNPKATLVIVNKLKEEIKNFLEKESVDKYRITIILESLININDKRALYIIGFFLNSLDDDLKSLTKKAFDKILPNWREYNNEELKNI